MFLTALNQYYKLRKNSFKLKEFDKSSYELYELTINKKFRKGRLYFLELPKNLILLFLSLYSVIKTKIKKIDKANYFIAFNNQLYDPRSENYISKLDHKKFLNIIRVNDFTVSIKAFFKYENVFFHQPISYFTRFFYFENDSTLKEKFLFIHKTNLRREKVYFFLFKFLKIKKFIMLDDYREIQNFISICRKLNIFSIGVMHSRFSKFRVPLIYDCFDKYIVWSEYFKKKLLEINSGYKNKVVINNFRNFKKIKNKQFDKDLKILFFSDSRMDYTSVIKYLDQLKNKKNVKVLIKLKSNQNENEQFLRYTINSKFIIVNEKDVKTTVQKYNPQFFLATNSNVLLEASLYDCYPILLKTKNDYSFDLIKDEVVIQYSGNNNFDKFLRKLINKKYLINKIYKKVWESKSDIKNIKNFLN